MPIPKTYRVNPIDLQPNVAVGISLPFNGSAVFNSTYTTKDQVKYNLINVLLTNKGERIENPEFGSNIKAFLFEMITKDNIDNLRDLIIESVTNYVPEIILDSILITPSPDNNSVEIRVDYKMKLSKETDNVTINFE